MAEQTAAMSSNHQRSRNECCIVRRGLLVNDASLQAIMTKAKQYGSGFRSIIIQKGSPRWNLFGDVDDMEQICWYVKNNFVASDTPFFSTWDIVRDGYYGERSVKMG